MASIEYSLFRAKFVLPLQKLLFDKAPSPRDMFIEAINDRPSAELRAGYTWHIGNIRKFTDQAGYFAVGRTTSATVEKFDQGTGNFLEEELETSPYTHVVFDASIGILGIAKKPALAPSAKGIASKIQLLLGQTKIVLENEVDVEIAPIPDPDGFIKAIAAAYRVTRFTASFKGPNPIDADELFQRPLAVYCSAVGGEKGKTVVQGADLNRETVQAVARSSAATGNDASARIVKTPKQKPITVTLAGDAIKKKYDEDTHDPKEVLADMMSLYKKVRSHE